MTVDPDAHGILVLALSHTHLSSWIVDSAPSSIFLSCLTLGSGEKTIHFPTNRWARSNSRGSVPLTSVPSARTRQLLGRRKSPGSHRSSPHRLRRQHGRTVLAHPPPNARAIAAPRTQRRQVRSQKQHPVARRDRAEHRPLPSGEPCGKISEGREGRGRGELEDGKSEDACQNKK